MIYPYVLAGLSISGKTITVFYWAGGPFFFTTVKSLMFSDKVIHTYIQCASVHRDSETAGMWSPDHGVKMESVSLMSEAGA